MKTISELVAENPGKEIKIWNVTWSYCGYRKYFIPKFENKGRWCGVDEDDDICDFEDTSEWVLLAEEKTLKKIGKPKLFMKLFMSAGHFYWTRAGSGWL